MMRLAAFGGLLLLGACSGETPPEQAVPAGFVSRRVSLTAGPQLPSPRGSLTLLVPTRYDTLLTWVDAADTPVGDKAKYRLVSSRGCLLRESGYRKAGTFCQDTLDRLTIATQFSTGAEESLASLEKRIRHADEVNRDLGRPATVWKSKQLRVINGRPFSVVEYVGGTEQVAEPYAQVKAVTVVQDGARNWELTLHFECKHANCRGLAEQAAIVLESVRVNLAATPTNEAR